MNCHNLSLNGRIAPEGGTQTFRLKIQARLRVNTPVLKVLGVFLWLPEQISLLAMPRGEFFISRLNYCLLDGVIHLRLLSRKNETLYRPELQKSTSWVRELLAVVSPFC